VTRRPVKFLEKAVLMEIAAQVIMIQHKKRLGLTRVMSMLEGMPKMT
jgi:hypothetical protein